MKTATFTGPAGHLAYRTWRGDASPTWVCLPGLTCHGGYFAGIAEGLGGTVRALDWRGHGASAPAPSYGFADYEADLAAFVTHLGLTNVILLGHSLGGYIALQHAATRPAWLRAVVAVDVKTSASDEELAGAARAAERPQPRAASLEDLAAKLRGGLAHVSEDALLTLADEGADENDDGTWSFTYDRRALAIEPVDPFAFAPQVACPVLVLHGAESPVMDAAAAQRLAAAVQQGTWATVPQAGHHPFLDAPEAFLERVRAFVAG